MSNLANKYHQSLLPVIPISAALMGLADALYLTTSHYQGKAVVCSIVEGCSVVLSSPWASFFGLPVSLIGAVYYGVILLLIVWYLSNRSAAFLQILLAISTVGFIASLGFLYLQIFVLTAFCEFCLLSLVTTTIIWISVLVQTYRPGDTMIT